MIKNKDRGVFVLLNLLFSRSQGFHPFLSCVIIFVVLCDVILFFKKDLGANKLSPGGR